MFLVQIQTSNAALSELQASATPSPPLVVEVPLLSPTSPAPASVPTNQTATRGLRMSGTPFSAFDGEDLFKLEAELGEGSCKQILAEDQSPGAGGFVWPALSPPVTRLPTLVERPRGQLDGGHVAEEGAVNGAEKSSKEVRTTESVTPKQSVTPGKAAGGILSPKRVPPPPPSKLPAASTVTAELPNLETSPSKLRGKAVSMTLDWGDAAANGEDSWLHFEDPSTISSALPEPLIFSNAPPAVTVAALTLPDPIPVPLSAAYLSARVHPEPEAKPGAPLSPDSLAAPSPTVKSFLGDFGTPDKGAFTPPAYQGFVATDGVQKPAFTSLVSSLPPSVQSLLNVSTPPPGNSPSSGVASSIPVPACIAGGQSSPSIPGSPVLIKTPLRKPPPPPSGLQRTGPSEPLNPAPTTPNPALQDLLPSQPNWPSFGEPSEQKASEHGTSTSAIVSPSSVEDVNSQMLGFCVKGGSVEPLSPSSDLFMKVGGLGAPAKLPPDWTALRPNPVYEPNGQLRRRRSSDGDLIQEKKAPSTTDSEPTPPTSVKQPTLKTERNVLVDAPAVHEQPKSPDSSHMNLLGDDWFLGGTQTPTSPTAVTPPVCQSTDKASSGERVGGLRPLSEADRKKCTAAFGKIARSGREYVTQGEAEGIFSRANIPGQPFERLW